MNYFFTYQDGKQFFKICFVIKKLLRVISHTQPAIGFARQAGTRACLHKTDKSLCPIRIMQG